MRIGFYAQPILDQQAGIHYMVKQMLYALNEYSDLDIITIATKRVTDKGEHIFVSSWDISFFNPRRWIFKRNMDAYRLDWVIDTTHFGLFGLWEKTQKLRIIHDITALKRPEQHRLKTVIAHRLLLKLALNESDRLLVFSEFVKKDLINLNQQEEKVLRIPPGRDYTFDMVSERNENRKSPYFLIVGTIEPRKNHKRIISAFNQFCSLTKLKYRLVIAGGEGWKTNIRRLIVSSPYSDQIEYLGYCDRDEISRLMSTATALLYVSEGEGFGMPVLEALQQGCPVITSTSSSMQEILGGSGIFVDPQSIRDITQAMLQMTKSKSTREEYSIRGETEIVRFQWHQFVESLENNLTAGLR